MGNVQLELRQRGKVWTWQATKPSMKAHVSRLDYVLLGLAVFGLAWLARLVFTSYGLSNIISGNI